MPRPSLGERAMTDAERQRKRRERLRQERPPDPLREAQQEIARLRQRVHELEAGPNRKARGGATQAEIDRQVQSAVSKHIRDVLYPMYGEKLRQADAILNGNMAFTNAEYRILLAGYHAACSQERRDAAFNLLKREQHRLRDSAEKLSTGFPKTIEEWDARRKPKR